MADDEQTKVASVAAEEGQEDDVIGGFDLKKAKKKKPKKDRSLEEGLEEVTEKIEELDVVEAGEGLLDLKKKKKKAPAQDGEAAQEDEATILGVAVESGEKKKKKKQKERKGEEVPEEALAAVGAKQEEQQPAEEEEVEGGAEGGEEEEGEEVDEDDEEEAEGIELGPAPLPWEGSDRDYKYDELLDRVFSILRQNNPELAGEKRRTIMRPPQVLREGTKKTVFVNLMDLCKTMHRQPDHVIAFLLAELGTSGSLDGQQRLVVKGRFAPKNFEGILRRYVNEYVMCLSCKSPDTILSKENRLFFVRCEQCGSHRSVAPIKAGFVARVGKRKPTAG